MDTDTFSYFLITIPFTLLLAAFYAWLDRKYSWMRMRYLYYENFWLSFCVWAVILIVTSFTVCYLFDVE